MNPNTRFPLALVAIGNPLAGDDGAGAEVLRLLEGRWGGDPRIRFLNLEAELFALADHLLEADHLIFLDAMAGDTPGELRTGRAYQRGFSPSFHQSDLGTVMQSLEKLGLAAPFPTWEAWGIVIAPPREYRLGLSPEVEAAARELADRVDARIRELLRPTRAARLRRKRRLHRRIRGATPSRSPHLPTLGLRPSRTKRSPRTNP